MEIAVVGLMMGMAAQQAAGVLLGVPPLARRVAYMTNKLAPNLIPEMPSLIVGRYRGLISEEEFLEGMKRHGCTPEIARFFFEISRPTLEAGDLITLYRRRKLKLEEFHQSMERLGYTHEQIVELLHATEYFPGAADLIRFAVREVYSPEVRRKYGMDEDYPEEFEKEAAKAGLPIEQAKNYWAAHWELPSLSAGYEMLHRRVITRDELMDLMRAQDIMPYWRERLEKISYAPYTRVDIRRMYDAGVLSRDEVLNAYMDLGYDEEHAAKLTEWTISESRGTERDLTRSMVLEAYEEGELTREETLNYLTRLRYDPSEAELILSLKEHDLQHAAQKEQIQALQAAYRAGAVSEEDFRAQLDAMNLRAAYRDKILYSTIREKKAKVALPSRTDLGLWLTRGIITVPEYIDAMRELGYRDQDIQRYLAVDKKLPTRADLKRWFIEDKIDLETWTLYMRYLGYSDEDIGRYWAEIQEERIAKRQKEMGGK